MGIRDHLLAASSCALHLEQERDEALADGERFRQAADLHLKNYRAMQSRYDSERIAHAKTAKQLATLSNPAPVSHQQENDMRAMQDQLQDLSSRLVALQNDSSNYHHLLHLMGARSMVAAISWIQGHQRYSDFAGSGRPMSGGACGSLHIGSLGDKDVGPY